MKYVLYGGPADGVEFCPDEVWPVGEILIPVYRREPTHHFGYGIEPGGDFPWAARYRLRSDGRADFRGWERT